MITADDERRRDKLKRVARYQRWMLVALIFWICVQAYIVATYAQSRPMIVHFGILAVIVVSVVSVFMLAHEFYHPAIAFLGAVLVAIPPLSLLVLYAVNYSATKYLREHGVCVGFFGANPKRI